MTVQETGPVLDMLAANWTREFHWLSEAERAAKVALWASVLTDEAADDVRQAVVNIIGSSKSATAPVVGAVKAEVARIRENRERRQQLDDTEWLFALVQGQRSKAIDSPDSP